MKRIFKYILASLIALLGISPVAAIDIPVEVASASVIQDATTKLEASHDALLDIKDNSTITDAEKAEKGIDARKDIITNAISLSLTEIDNIRADLLKLPKFTEESIETDMQNRFLADLDSYSEYYDTKSEELDNITTVDEAKIFAKEIIDYRTNTYNPSIEKMAEFSLLFYTEVTINTANARMAKMLSDIKKLEKLNLFKLTLVSTKISHAIELLKNSTEKYLQAKNLIIKEEVVVDISVKDPIVTETESIDENIQEIAPIDLEMKIEIVPPTAKEWIEMSLTDIKSTYDIFIQISKDIRKSLGLK